MKKNIYLTNLIVIFTLIFYSCAPAYNWKQISSGNNQFKADISSLIFFSIDKGIAISRCSIYQTSDGGKTWKLVLDRDDGQNNKIIKINDETALVIGSESRKTKDSLNSQSLYGSQQVQPAIFQTQNSGSDWNQIVINSQLIESKENRFPSFNDLCIDKSDTVWIVGDKGIIHGSLIKNKLETIDIIDTDEAVTSVVCRSSGDIFAVGVFGTLLRFNTVWTKIKIPNNAVKEEFPLLSKIAEKDGTLWVIGNRSKGNPNKPIVNLDGVLFKSQDNGQTWEDKTPPSASGLFDIYFNGKNGWLVGMNGNIFRTTDGDSWIKANSPTENNLSNIFFLDANNGWIVGEKSTILKYQN